MKILDRIKADPRVEELSYDGRKYGYWVMLKKGWGNWKDCHVLHELTLRDLWHSFKSLEPCACFECRESVQGEKRSNREIDRDCTEATKRYLDSLDDDFLDVLKTVNKEFREWSVGR